MGVRFIIIFYLLFVVCRDANGARNVLKQEQKEEDAPYITSYGNKEGIQEADNGVWMYGKKESKVKEVEAPYITGYISAQDNTKEVGKPYNTEGRSDTNEVEAPYITGYISTRGTKSTENVEEVPNYIMQYGDKKASRINQYGTKEDNSGVEQTYQTGYKTTRKTNEVEAPYITGYISTRGTKSTENVEVPNYITQYGDKEASRINQYGSKEDNSEVEHTYQTSYKATQERNEVEAPYTTGYISTQSTKQTTKEVEAPYITGYISAQGTKNCKHKKHVNPPSQNVDSGKDSDMGHDQHHDHMHPHSSSPMDHTEALKQGFFTFEDFYKGNSLPLNFPKQEHSRFLPKETADSIPFSTSQLPHLLQLFSIPHDSRDAKHMAWTLDQCELKPIKGETKFCATSLESMTDFVQKIIGSGVSFNILSTTHPETSTSITQKYTILDEPKQVLASKMVFCHPVPYPYAVFFCHHFENDTKFFKVSLGGENGDKVEAVAVCHMDTSDWDPNHDLFRLLGIKAGASSPVCHFFPANHLVWIPSSPTAASV